LKLGLRLNVEVISYMVIKSQLFLAPVCTKNLTSWSLTKPNPTQPIKSRNFTTQPNPTQPNPWMDPTRVQLWKSIAQEWSKRGRQYSDKRKHERKLRLYMNRSGHCTRHRWLTAHLKIRAFWFWNLQNVSNLYFSLK